MSEFTKTDWNEGAAPGISAAQLDRMEAGIEDAHYRHAFKEPCRVASTGNIALSGEQTFDGIAVVAGDRVLVKNQTTSSENGIYKVAVGAWSRAADADDATKLLPGLQVAVTEGSANADTVWLLTTNAPIIVGTTGLTFVKAGITGHEAAADPHPGYLTPAEGDAAYINEGQVAGGVLGGSYPNPGFASDMATQAELDAHINDATAAHAASAISYGGATGLSATDVEGAIDELAAERVVPMTHTWAIAGEIKVAVADADFIVPMFLFVPTGWTAVISRARHRINVGASVTAKLQKNGVDLIGFTGISVTTTSTTTDSADQAIADTDRLALVVTAVSGTPKNLSFSIEILLTRG